jgi:enoyl-CoA hydratase
MLAPTLDASPATIASLALAATAKTLIAEQEHLENADSELLVERCRDHVVHVTVNRPERHNALSANVISALSDRANEFDRDPTIRVVVLRGAGTKAFVSGADIGELGTGIDGGRSTGNRPSMFAAAMPVIAMIQGYCIGAGLALALEADLRIASDEAIFSIPAGRLGIAYPNDAVERLVALIGVGEASRLLLTGERIGAERALSLGLVNEVVPRSELESRVDSLADTIAANAPLSMRAAKASVLAAVRGGRPDELRAAEELARVCWLSSDFAEGRAAFAEKRPPNWTGR